MRALAIATVLALGARFATSTQAKNVIQPDAAKFSKTLNGHTEVVTYRGRRAVKLANSISLVLVEQHIELALRVSQYAYVMDRGSIALEGPCAQVRTDANLLHYLSP